MNVCVLTMFKNESHIIREWASHYLRQGVDHIFMIDDQSNDGYLDILRPFIESGKVTLIPNTHDLRQSPAYNTYALGLCKSYKWTIVCDLDEFIYARRGFSRIGDFLNTVDDSVQQIAIPWKMFGSDGHKMQPESVIKSFTKRCNYDKVSGYQAAIVREGVVYSLNKCIVRTATLVAFDIHSHHVHDNSFTITSCMPLKKKRLTVDNCTLTMTNEKILQYSCLHLNHYAIQSLDFFTRVKITRGDATYKGHDVNRNISYFNRYDACSSDIVDLELAELDCL